MAHILDEIRRHFVLKQATSRPRRMSVVESRFAAAPIVINPKPDIMPKHHSDVHKYQRGFLTIIAGNIGMLGAGLLSAKAALRSGAGLVCLVTHDSHLATVPAVEPNLLVDAFFSASSEDKMARSSVIALGPGLGRNDQTADLLTPIFEMKQRLVLDADALYWLSESSDKSKTIPGQERLLTPHPGEAARLLGTDVSAIQSDRQMAACELAEDYNAVVVLKGADTCIATPTGACVRLDFSESAAAKGGMGDLLCGMIASLWAQNMTAVDAAIMGAWWHADVIQRALMKQSQYTLQPTDLLDYFDQTLETI